MALMKFREPNEMLWVGIRPGHRGTQVLEWKLADNATEIVYTVPAGKVFYLTFFSWYSSRNINAWGAVAVWDTTPAEWRRLIRMSGFTGEAGNAGAVSLSFPIEIPAAYSIRVKSSAAGFSAGCTVHGWVE